MALDVLQSSYQRSWTISNNHEKKNREDRFLVHPSSYYLFRIFLLVTWVVVGLFHSHLPQPPPKNKPNKTTKQKTKQQNKPPNQPNNQNETKSQNKNKAKQKKDYKSHPWIHLGQIGVLGVFYLYLYYLPLPNGKFSESTLLWLLCFGILSTWVKFSGEMSSRIKETVPALQVYAK